MFFKVLKIGNVLFYIFFELLKFYGLAGYNCLVVFVLGLELYDDGFKAFLFSGEFFILRLHYVIFFSQSDNLCIELSDL